MRLREKVAALTGLACLCLAVLAIGGAPRWSVIALVAMAAISAGVQLVSRARFSQISPLLVIVAVPAALTALQLVPLPPGIADALGSSAHDLVRDGRTLLGAGSDDTWHPLSLDPATTRTELAKLFAYVLIAWMAVRHAATLRGRYRLLAAVAGVGGAVALIGLIHRLLGAESLYGFYRPEHANPLVMTPLLNPNHLACFMVMCALCAGGLALHERRAPPVRALWIVIAIGCVLTAFETRSRGGVLGLAAGVTVMALVVILQRLRSRRRGSRSEALRILLPGAVILMCSIVLAIYVGASEIQQDIDSTQLQELSDPRSKFAAWRSSLELFEEAPILGIGRGAFQTAFTRVHEAAGKVTFSHAENEYLQVALDWGVVGALSLAGAFALAIVMVARRWRKGVLAAAAIAALTAVGVQSMVDFGLELPGVAVPAILVASVLLYVPMRREPRTARVMAGRAAVIALALAAGVLASTSAARTITEDQDTLRSAGATEDVARAILLRHPLDYLSAAQVSRLTTSLPDRVAFLNFAMRLHPTHPDLHRTAARWLNSSGRTEQAALEYRLALLGGPEPTTLVAEVIKTLGKPDLIIDALPASDGLARPIERELLANKRTDLAVKYLLKAGSADRTDVSLWRQLRTLAVDTNQLEVAERAARQLLSLDGSVTSRVELAKILLQEKKHEEADTTLRPLLKQPAATEDDLLARILLCEVSIARKSWDESRQCLVDTLSSPIATLAARQQAHRDLAIVEEALGNKERAALERKLGGVASTPSTLPPPATPTPPTLNPVAPIPPRK